MIGYKAFNEDLTCREFQYEIGKEFKMNSKPKLCARGFHFCKTIADCYEYYDIKEETRICKVEALGDIDTRKGENKLCTNHIKILEEITGYERYGNDGTENTGYCNKGERNIGNRNEGEENTGYGNKGRSNRGSHNEGHANLGEFNCGNFNRGHSNKGNDNNGFCNNGDYNNGSNNDGDHNVGDHNAGNFNVGIYNDGNFNRGISNKGSNNRGSHNVGSSNNGNYNEGDYNIGIRNKCNYAFGILCTQPQEVWLFNKPSGLTLKDLYDSGVIDDVEKGFLSDRVMALPNFDAEIWDEIINKRQK